LPMPCGRVGVGRQALSIISPVGHFQKGGREERYKEIPITNHNHQEVGSKGTRRPRPHTPRIKFGGEEAGGMREKEKAALDKNEKF